MIIGDTPCPPPSRKDLARTFLRMHGLTGSHLAYYVRMGRQYGLTEDEIRESVTCG